MRHILTLIFVFAVMLTQALPISAQDLLSESYTSSDGSLQFSYPAGWVAWGYGTNFGYIANSEAARTASKINGQLVSGQVIISIEAISFDSPDKIVTLEDMIASMESVFGSESGSQFEQAGITIELISASAISDRMDNAAETTYRRTGSDFSEEVLNLAIVSGTTGMLDVNVTAPQGETAQYRDLVLAVAASIQFNPPAPGGLVIPGAGAAAVPGSGDVVWKQERIWGSSPEDFRGLGSIGIGTDGLIYIADDDAGIRVLDADGSVLRTITNTEISQFDDVAVASDGSLWVVNSFTSQVYHLDTQGNLLLSFGEMGSEPGQFGDLSPAQIEIGTDGNLYFFNRREHDYASEGSITVYAPDGTFVSEFPTDPDDEFTLYGFGQIAVAPDGTIYAGDLFTMEVRGFAPDGTITRRGVGAQVLMGVQAVTVGPDGSVYAAGFSMESIIYKFDASGNLLAQYNVSGVMSFVGGLGVLPDGSMIVAGPSATQDASVVVRLVAR